MISPGLSQNCLEVPESMAVPHSTILVQFMNVYVASPIDVDFSDGVDVSCGAVPLVASPFRTGFGMVV